MAIVAIIESRIQSTKPSLHPTGCNDVTSETGDNGRLASIKSGAAVNLHE
jgi:hypothetical protein